MNPLIEDGTSIYEQPIVHEQSEVQKNVSREALLVAVIETAAKYHVNADSLVKTIDCESGFNPSRKGDYSTTTAEYTSFGLAQIHLPAHPDISLGQALDPYYSINFIAQQFSEGHEYLWTCWRDQFHV